MTKHSLRSAIAHTLSDVVIAQHALPMALAKYGTHLSAQQKSQAQFVCYGVLRQYYSLEQQLNLLMDKPLKKKEHLIKHLLLAGIFQRLFSNIKAHAIVNESVKAASSLGKSWAKGLVNAVLRKVTPPMQLPEVDTHPAWLRQHIQKQYPELAQQILQANLQPAPMTLRVNQRQYTREEYLQKLTFTAEPCLFAKQGLTLSTPVTVAELPEFSQGAVSVQDQAGQLLPSLLDLKPQQRVLDACAAPGSKTSHLLESEPSLELIALDIEATRLQLVNDNLQRLGLQAKTIAADVLDLSSWSDGKTFDTILLDAPCSATGVIRRHPDILFLRRESDIAQLNITQAKMLETLWPLLKPGGKLLYSTCSILTQENDCMIEQFVASCHDVVHCPINAPWGRALSFGRQILPIDNNMDGFYYALLQKKMD